MHYLMVHLDDQGHSNPWCNGKVISQHRHRHLLCAGSSICPVSSTAGLIRWSHLKLICSFVFVEVNLSSLMQQSVTVQLKTGMEKDTGQGAEKGRWKVPCSHSLIMQPHPFDSQCQKSIAALLSYGHFKSYFSSPVVWQECYVPSFKYSYPGTPSKTFIFIMFFFWTLFTKPARITKKLRFEW